MARKNLTVLDLFCGAGGFSEGFRQQGFEIVRGVDCWSPATETFNHNFNLNCKTQDISLFRKGWELIDALPNTDIIIGSPPCVSFSSSNRCGGVDKGKGVELIETFLRVVAIKKYQPESRLEAWFMENVINSQKYLRDEYTFQHLGLSCWARNHDINPSDIAISLKNNCRVLNSHDFGVAQSRRRLFAGEVVKLETFPDVIQAKVTKPIAVRRIFRFFPHPFKNQNKISDPNYKNIHVTRKNLTDHFYDTGIYKVNWLRSQYHKTNHPYMGKMFFPENMDNPSRTVTASKLDGSREALIYCSELGREGDGEYRTPTIREIAVLMSFPITYQFSGSEGTKWRLVGNAVAPLVSGAIAKATLKALGIPALRAPRVQKSPRLDGVNNLNTFQEKRFDSPPVRKPGCRFRRHPFKDGNMTIALSNYCLKENKLADKKWRTTVTYGQGASRKIQEINSREQQKIRRFIEKEFADGAEFLQAIHDNLAGYVASGGELQQMHENNQSNDKLSPAELIDETARLVKKYANGEIVDTPNIFQYKDAAPKAQVYALYAINQISKIANTRK